MAQTFDEQELSQQFLYPLNDPNTAFTNALRKMGVNPNRSNPFVTQLQKYAPASRVAFLGDFAQRPTQMGTPNYASPEAMYGNYLQGQLQQGNLVGSTNAAANNFGSLLAQVKAFEDQLGAGTNITSLNPYTAALRDLFRSDDSMGALGAYASLRAPRMGSLGSSYARAIQSAGQSAQANYYNQGNIHSDPFDWLFTGGVF